MKQSKKTRKNMRMKARELSKKLHVDDTLDGLTLLEYEVKGS
jgi:hypothetical protein